MVDLLPAIFGKLSCFAHNRIRRNAWTLAALLALCCGCSDGRPPLFPVHGVIQFSSGEPVRQATIELVPESPSPSPRGRTDSTGQFKLGTYESEDGAPAGEYRVIVLQVLPPRAAEHVRKLGAEHAEHGGRIPVVSLKYASPKSSELSCTVKPTGHNELKLTVEPR